MEAYLVNKRPVNIRIRFYDLNKNAVKNNVSSFG